MSLNSSLATPVSRYTTLLGREIHTTEWGAQDAPALIAWHGLARTGRDMDALAQAFCGQYRVICPDTLGRGLSQWSPEPAKEYCLDFYAQLATALFDTLGLVSADWVGTSMGGAIGLVAAAGPLRGRIRKLVLNDVGPELARPAIERIRSYAGSPASFATVTELEAYFRTVYQPYGYLSDAQWRLLTESSVRRLPDGRVTPHYDPAMVQQFIHHPNDYERWPEYDSLSLPTLCLRGATSDLLLPDVAERMTQRGPKAQLVTIEGCGHAPALNVPAQWVLIREFLA